MKFRNNGRAGLLMALTVVTAVGWVAFTTTQATAGTPIEPATAILTAKPMTPGMRMPNGTRMPGKPLPAGPSASARMVCSQEVRRNVATALALKTRPVPTATWANHLYTCTYHLSGGPLVFIVKEGGNIPTARAYLTGLRQRLAPMQHLQGAISLGLPAYETSYGRVVFLKDDKTLQVDAAAMPRKIGPQGESRTTFAYQMATDVLGCWSGK